MTSPLQQPRNQASDSSDCGAAGSAVCVAVCALVGKHAHATQSVVAIHRHPQIDRAAGDGGKHVARLRKGELEQAQQSLHALVGDFDAIVQIVEQRARLGIEPDVPDPARILDLGTWPDRHLGPEKMRDPALQQPAQPFERAPSAVQVHGEVVLIVPIPVGRGVVLRQHVEVDSSSRGTILRQQLTQAAEAAGGGVPFHGLDIGGHHCTVSQHAHALRTEEHFRRPGFHRRGGLG